MSFEGNGMGESSPRNDHILSEAALKSLVVELLMVKARSDESRDTMPLK
jgi:hypothetical protein